jgi:rod shape-determining protein MreC
MTSLLANRAVRRRGITFAVLLAVTLFLMAFSSNAAVLELQRGLSFAFQPALSALNGVATGVANMAVAIGEIDQLRTDNAALREDNARLENENARLQQYGRENESLTALLQLRAGLDHATVAARVIARESSEARRLVVLDKGTSDGIAAGDAVIVAGGALAGRVTDAGPNFAKVTLITDPSTTVVGQLSSSGKTGNVVGQLQSGLTMGEIDATAQVELQEEVFTAGIEIAGGIRSPYPKGLLIGRVLDVKRDANDVVQTAFLLPAADLDSVEVALVITDYEGGLPPVDQQPVPCDSGDGTLPSGEVPCYTPSPRPTRSTPATSAPSAKP